MQHCFGRPLKSSDEEAGHDNGHKRQPKIEKLHQPNSQEPCLSNPNGSKSAEIDISETFSTTISHARLRMYQFEVLRGPPGPWNPQGKHFPELKVRKQRVRRLLHLQGGERHGTPTSRVTRVIDCTRNATKRERDPFRIGLSFTNSDRWIRLPISSSN